MVDSLMIPRKADRVIKKMEAATRIQKLEAVISIKDSMEGSAIVNVVINEKEKKQRRKKKKKSGGSQNVQTENADTCVKDSVEGPAAAVNVVINKKEKKKKKKSGRSPNVQTENADTSFNDSVEGPAAAVNVVINKKEKSGSSSNVQTENADTRAKDSVEGPAAVNVVIDKKEKKSGMSPNVQTENADTRAKDSVEGPAAVNVVINKKEESGMSPNVQTENADTCVKDSVEGSAAFIVVINKKEKKSGSSSNVQTENAYTCVKDSVKGPDVVHAVINENEKKKIERNMKSGTAPDVQTKHQDDKITGNPICGNNGQLPNMDLTTMVNSTNQQLLPAVPFRFSRHVRTARRTLLILDLNGLLADIVRSQPLDHKPDIYINGRAIFKRPYIFDFLRFCFERFDVGVWSSRPREIIVQVVDYLFGNLKHKLLFCWDMAHCTATRFNTLENRYKPLVFKDLRRLWEKQYYNLPWKRGDYNESNTVLLDDSPYKALLNPVNTSVFPFTFTYKDTNDESLGPRGDLRVYLEGLANSENVQTYIGLNPFGQPAINDKSSLWCFYSQVLNNLSAKPNRW